MALTELKTEPLFASPVFPGTSDSFLTAVLRLIYSWTLRVQLHIPYFSNSYIQTEIRLFAALLHFIAILSVSGIENDL